MNSGEVVNDAYITVQEAAARWGISKEIVEALCSNKHISNATLSGSTWFIPRSTLRPKSISTLKKETKVVKPFLKWAGGKSQLLPEIRKFYPFNEQITKYAEPFVGGGAVLFDILSNYDLQEVYISDLNSDLVNSYIIIRDNVNELVDLLQQKQDKFLQLCTDDRKELFYNERATFNKLKHAPSDDNGTQRAALMIFLNRTCFNGLYRVNRKGDFNVPMGAYKHPLICDEDNLTLMSAKLQNVQIQCADYKKVSDFADEYTFLYFDPPYRPLTKTANFTSYNESEFDDQNQRELADFIKLLSERGCRVLASNSDPKNVDEGDNFFEDIYSGLNIHRVKASRMINSRSSSRGKINELLISNY